MDSLVYYIDLVLLYQGWHRLVSFDAIVATSININNLNKNVNSLIGYKF